VVADAIDGTANEYLIDRKAMEECKQEVKHLSSKGILNPKTENKRPTIEDFFGKKKQLEPKKKRAPLKKSMGDHEEEEIEDSDYEYEEEAAEEPNPKKRSKKPGKNPFYTEEEEAEVDRDLENLIGRMMQD